MYMLGFNYEVKTRNKLHNLVHMMVFIPLFCHLQSNKYSIFFHNYILFYFLQILLNLISIWTKIVNIYMRLHNDINALSNKCALQKQNIYYFAN